MPGNVTPKLWKTMVQRLWYNPRAENMAIWPTTRRSADNSDHKYDLQALASALVLQSIETHYSYEDQFKGVDVERPQQPKTICIIGVQLLHSGCLRLLIFDIFCGFMR